MLSEDDTQSNGHILIFLYYHEKIVNTSNHKKLYGTTIDANQIKVYTAREREREKMIINHLIIS